jgi:Papain-like cysteine protease AvrRpt2
MPLPELLTTGASRPIAGLAVASTAAGGQAAAPGIDFVIQRQGADQWCWAAVTVSVALHYDPATSVTQCQLAKLVIGANGCCDDPTSDACNQQADLELALDRTQHLRQGPIDPLDFGALMREITARRLVCCRIETDGVGHFVVISGCSEAEGSQSVDVHDPQGLQIATYSYETLLTNYLGAGRWTHAYLTE